MRSLSSGSSSFRLLSPSLFFGHPLSFNPFSPHLSLTEISYHTIFTSIINLVISRTQPTHTRFKPKLHNHNRNKKRGGGGRQILQLGLVHMHMLYTQVCNMSICGFLVYVARGKEGEGEKEGRGGPMGGAKGGTKSLTSVFGSMVFKYCFNTKD